VTQSGNVSSSTDASPDELLLELMDLVTLAMPKPMHHMRISFVQNEDGRRPALSDLDGRAAMNAPARVDLGHQDGHVLDAINALLQDLSVAVHARGGRHLRKGDIDIDTDDDGARNVIITDRSETPPVVHVTRRFDRSELRWLLFTSELYQVLSATQMQAHDLQLQTKELLMGAQRFVIDMSRAIITFSADGRPDVPWRFQLLGSYADNDKRFLWGHANDAIEPSMAQAVIDLRARSLGEGLRLFTDASVGGPEPMARRLCAHAAVEANASGFYVAPFQGREHQGVMYLALFAA
jgi:hypothetical protein